MDNERNKVIQMDIAAREEPEAKVRQQDERTKRLNELRDRAQDKLDQFAVNREVNWL